VDISGKDRLELRVTDGGDGINSDHADWANPRVSCSNSVSLRLNGNLARP
jgi:hypothetical protein